VQGDNQGIDELDHYLSPGLKGSVGQKKDSKNSTTPYGLGSTPAGSRKVIDWPNLCQGSDEKKLMGDCELGDYSCAKLLREMEATTSNSRDDHLCMAKGDDELVTIPESGLANMDQGEGLPAHLYDLPEIDGQDGGGG
jgi:hypothetical protein